jgi:hypothetical protein
MLGPNRLQGGGVLHHSTLYFKGHFLAKEKEEKEVKKIVG